MKKTQLKLIEPFFTEELDYKNDYVTYIEVSNSSSVTSKNNNSKISLNLKKFNASCHDILFYKSSRCLDIYDSNNRLILGITLPQSHKYAYSLI